MYARNAFGRKADCRTGKHDIIIYQRRSMAYFHENILAAHCPFCHRRSLRRVVIVEKVLGDTCPLCFPVCPNPHGGVMNMVPAHYYVNGSVKLDS